MGRPEWWALFDDFRTWVLAAEGWPASGLTGWL